MSAPGRSHALIAEHAVRRVSTAAVGRFVASGDRPPPWTTLQRGTLTPFMGREVAL